MKSSLSFLAATGLFLGMLGGVAPDARGEDKAPAKPASPGIIHVSAMQAAPLVTSNGVAILDVRTPGEFAGGHIAGATNLDFLAGGFVDKVARLDRDKTYLVHCATGKRSTNCLAQLEKLGFKRLVHLDGGFKAWQAAGNPITKN